MSALASLVVWLCSECTACVYHGDARETFARSRQARVPVGVARLGTLAADYAAVDGIINGGPARTCDACTTHMTSPKWYRHTVASARANDRASGRIALGNACSRYGASMGRPSDPLFGRVRVQRMRLTDGGAYDSGGAYWGSGAPMWAAEDDDGRRSFVRAATRGLAKNALAVANPGIKFAR